jgi:hypothetical protein
LSLDEDFGCPLAGPLNDVLQRRIDVAVGLFPFARRTADGRRAWRIEVPGRSSSVEVWLTSDGSVFIEGETSLNLVYGLYVHLLDTVGNLAIEDRITGVVHNRASLLRLVRRDEERALPFYVGSPLDTPPLAA